MVRFRSGSQRIAEKPYNEPICAGAKRAREEEYRVVGRELYVRLKERGNARGGWHSEALEVGSLEASSKLE